MKGGPRRAATTSACVGKGFRKRFLAIAQRHAPAPGHQLAITPRWSDIDEVGVSVQRLAVVVTDTKLQYRAGSGMIDIANRSHLRHDSHFHALYGCERKTRNQ
jgi:hypothetical protein